MGRSRVEYRTGPYGNINELKMTSLIFNKDDEGYYLSAKYRVEDQGSVREVDIPRIRLNINEDCIAIDTEYSPYARREYAQIDLGFGYLPLEYTNINGHSVCFTEKILEEKYTEMTLDEIEKKLGHKIKIVNK